MVFLSLQINGSYTAHKSVFINIYNNNVLFWFMTISSLHRCENVNHVPSITYVPNHAYLSLVLMIGSGSGAKCHACINTNTYMDIYIYIFLCVFVFYGVLLSGFRHSCGYQAGAAIVQVLLFPPPALARPQYGSC